MLVNNMLNLCSFLLITYQLSLYYIGIGITLKLNYDTLISLLNHNFLNNM